MEIRTLKYFLAIAREESITKAAEILHVTQPTLSRQIVKLEEDLSVKLLDRGKNGITLTDEGILFRRRAAEIVELAEKTEREILESKQLISGEISIGCGELASVEFIIKLFMDFKKIYPNVHLDLLTGNADQTKQYIDDGILDMGILLEPVEIEKYNFLRLNVEENWVVVMKADDPFAEKEYITVEELKDLPLIITKRQSVRNEIESWFQSENLNIVASSNLSTNASVLVEQGIGYAFVIKGSLPYIDKSIITYRPLYPERKTTSVLAWKKHQPYSPAVKKFFEYLQCNLCIDNDKI